MTRLRDVAVSAILGMAAAGGLIWTFDHDTSVLPAPTPTVTVTPSGTGYTEPTGWGDTGGEGDEVVANAYIWAACTATSGYPCRIADMSEPGVTDADGGQHHHCVIIATSPEDSVAVCDDGTEWPS